MDICTQCSACRSSDRGFALISALIMAIIIGGLLIVLQMTIRTLAEETSSSSDEAELRVSLAAGLNRMIYAYVIPDDQMRELLVPDGRAVPWEFERKMLILKVQAESGKWDLNSGDRTQIAALVGRLASDPAALSRIMERIDQARATHHRITSVVSVLTPLERMTEFRDLFEAHFTVATEQLGIDPLTAPIRALEAIVSLPESERTEILRARRGLREPPIVQSAQAKRHFVGEKPTYTLHVQAAEGFRRTGAMRAVVGFSEEGGFSIFSWERSGLTRD